MDSFEKGIKPCFFEFSAFSTILNEILNKIFFKIYMQSEFYKSVVECQC